MCTIMMRMIVLAHLSVDINTIFTRPSCLNFKKCPNKNLFNNLT